MTVTQPRIEGARPVDGQKSIPPGSRTTPRRRKAFFPPARGLVILVVLLVLWQLLGNSRSPFYPRPSAWWDALAPEWRSGKLWPATAQTLEVFISSLVIATILGSILGFLTGIVHKVDRSLNPTMEFLRTMPAAAVVPVATLILGYKMNMQITVVVFAALWPVLLSARAAVRGINPRLADVGKTLHLSKGAQLRKIYLPAILPDVLVGVRVAAPLTLIIALLVEILTNTGGLGALISTAQNDFESALVYGLVAVACVLALIVNYLVVAIEAYISRYKAV